MSNDSRSGGGDGNKTIIYSLLVENKPGVLFRVASQFRRRHFNIESIAVGVTERRDTSRMTVTMYGDEQMADDFARILRRTIDVIDVERLRPENTIRKELALVRVRREGRDYVLSEKHGGVDVKELYTGGSLIVQVVGEPEAINEFVEELAKRKLLEEVVRTGVVAICKR